MNNYNENIEILKFRHPFTFYISGPTGCGKTIFISNFLNNLNDMMNPLPDKIVYFYSHWQDIYVKMLKVNPQIQFLEGVVTTDKLDSNKTNLIIIDDLMQECKDSAEIAKLFTKGSHHRNISVIFLSQNLFVQGKQARNISLNSHYICVFKNLRDRARFSCLSRQMFPQNSAFLNECFQDATKIPHGYLLLDFKQKTPDDLRVRTRIFPKEENFFYVEKDKTNKE